MARDAGNSITAPMGLAKTALVSLTAVVATLSMTVLHPAMAFPLAGLALIALAFGGRGAVSVGVCVVSGAIAGLFAKVTYIVIAIPLAGVPITARAPLVLGVLTVVSLLLVGPVAAALMRRRPALEVAATIAVGLSVAQVVALAALADGAGMSLASFMTDAVTGMVAEAGGLVEAADTISALWPSVTVALNGFSAIVVTAGAGLIAARRGVTAFRFPAVASIDLDPWFVVPGIVGIACLAAGRLPIGSAPVLDALGQNVLVVVRWVFFLQGVAVFAALYERAKVGRPARSLGYVVLGVTEMLVPLVSLTGLADVWLNIRRLPRDKQSDEVVEAPSDTD